MPYFCIDETKNYEHALVLYALYQSAGEIDPSFINDTKMLVVVKSNWSMYTHIVVNIF